jgi:mono/diheme cytochrome c family protein
MTTMKRSAGLAIFAMLWPLAASGQGVSQAAPGQSGRGQALFRGRVRRVLAETCVGCHNPDQKKGGLDLTRRAGAIRGGDSGPAVDAEAPAESLLLQKVDAGEMPPKARLSPPQVEAIRGWLAAGAPYPEEPVTQPRAGADWWSLQPVHQPLVPALRAAARGQARNPLDAFIIAKLEEKGLGLAPEADRGTLIRRLSFDLIGLPPSPEAVAAFVRDPAPDAYEKLVDRLLASPQHGERWSRHWLDVVRFGESEGYETNMPRFNAWPYRDYVIRTFNRDTPFPRFVLEQLAGDALADEGADWLTQAATGFLVGGTHDIVGNQTVEGMRQQRMDDLDDMITATGTAFLGLTINCCRCHDHKFDPVTQKDYYGLQAVFAGVSHGARAIPAADTPERRAEARRVAAELTRTEAALDEFEPAARPESDAPRRPMASPRRNVERFEPVRARMARMTILATSNLIEPCIDEFEVYTAGDSSRNVAVSSAGGKASASSEYPGAAIHKIAHLNDGQTGNGHSWISRVPGKGTISIEWPRSETIDRIVWGRDREGRYTDRLPTEYYLEVALNPGEWRVVASSVDRQPYRAEGRPEGPDGPAAGLTSELTARRGELRARHAALRARLEQLGSMVSVYAGTFTQPGPTHILRRGDPMQPAAEAAPSGITAVKPALMLPPDAPERERRIALARWIGDPANPLPARVMVNRLWHSHFGQGIVSTPSDFGFNGGAPSHPELLDWLASEYVARGWRLKPLHRLIVTSAAYRQSSRLHARAQSIDGQDRLLWRMRPRRLEAEALRDAILACSGRLDSRMEGAGYNIWQENTNYVAVYQPRAELGADAFRRMVYQFKPRSQQDPTFGAFDCPDAALVAPRRNTSTTALQALNLLNSRMVLRQAALFAERLKHDAGDDPARQADRGIALAFGRAPSAAERAAAAALIRSHGTATFCRALYNANEFVFAP